MKIDSQELENYVESILSAIKKGVDREKSFRIKEPIEFDLAVVKTKEGGGGFKILVADAKGKLKSQEISHIKFKVHPDIKPEGSVISPSQINRVKLNPAR